MFIFLHWKSIWHHFDFGIWNFVFCDFCAILWLIRNLPVVSRGGYRSTWWKQQPIPKSTFSHATWKYGIMKDLYVMDLRGRLPLLIQNFLPERKFRVKVKTSLADFYDQEMGISQSSMLSVTLFIVKINSFTSYIRNGVDKSLLVDDFGVSHWLKHIERQLQLHLDRIEDWADHNCYKLSQLKSVCVYFCWGTDPYLALYNNPILVKKDTKFFSILLDSKLITFVAHIKGLKQKCVKALKLFRVISNTGRGGDCADLLWL